MALDGVWRLAHECAVCLNKDTTAGKPCIGYRLLGSHLRFYVRAMYIVKIICISIEGNRSPSPAKSPIKEIDQTSLDHCLKS